MGKRFSGEINALSHSLTGAIFKMQSLTIMHQRVGRVTGHGRLRKPTEDELQLTFIGGDVADGEDAFLVSFTSGWVHFNMAEF